jgi:hypothetical protein
VKNKSRETLTVNLTGVISSIRYTGAVWSLVKNQKFENVEICGGKGRFNCKYDRKSTKNTHNQVETLMKLKKE